MKLTKIMDWPLTPLIKKRYLVALFYLVLQGFTAQAQNDLYGLSNSKKFANYLYLAQDYELASQELERVLFLAPQNDSIRLLLLKCYRLSGQNITGIQRFNDFYSSMPPQAPKAITTEYYQMLLREGNYGLAGNLLNQYEEFSKSFKVKGKAGLLLVNKEYNAAIEHLNGNGIYDPVLLSLANRGNNLPRKSPFASGLLSTLVPGLGKVYTGNWQDGLIAFVFVGANAFASYRGFNARGVESFYGWFFGSIGTAFYVSNIYGSVMSANKYNQSYINALNQDVEKQLYNFILTD